MTDRFLIFGHRGSSRRYPENTLAAFEGALAEGADGFETDLRLLSDRTAVLYHDDELDDADVESLTFTQLYERKQLTNRLDDLAAFAGRARMILEVKRSKWEEVLLTHVGLWPGAVIASFDHSAIAELARRNCTLPLGITFHGYLVDPGPYATRLGATWAFPNYHFVDEEMIRSFHGEGMKVIPWTSNRPREWDRLRELGCDGVITDLPAEAVAWRDGAGGGER
ncbi:MAG TPA: glycerophosphodiester phosphodiesterase [Thermoanaerobaculia bacterium]